MTLLFTKPQRAKLHANWAAQEAASSAGAPFDPQPVVKLFTPDAGATWLLAALSPDERVAYGVADLGLGFVEAGEIDLQELRALRGRLGLPVERDRWFKADKALSGYLTQGREAGRLVA